MPAVVKHMGQDYFVEHFLTALLLLLKDGVDEVREACAVTIPNIASTGTDSDASFCCLIVVRLPQYICVCMCMCVYIQVAYHCHGCSRSCFRPLGPCPLQSIWCD